MSPEEILKTLSEHVPVVRPKEPLSRHSTWAVGGPADYYVEVCRREELIWLISWCQAQGVPLFPIGQGSNLLIGDGGMRGVVVRLKGVLEGVGFDEENVLSGAGAFLPKLSREAAERNLSGVEFLCGIPGTVGGALMTNAGTREGWLGDVVSWVEEVELSGQTRIVPKSALRFGYRTSNLKGRWILFVGLKLRRGDKNVIVGKMQENLASRAASQPLGTYNGGSVFKNPPGEFAGRLVERAGLKGTQVGKARVSPRHANFIENIGGATAQDIRTLMELVRRTVEDKFQLVLEPEVILAGEP